MANEARQPDPGGTSTRKSDPKAVEERPEDREQPQGHPATAAGGPSHRGSKRYADTTETDTTGTGATGAGQPYSSGGGTSGASPSGGEPPLPS
jgi:hypothetical protein